MKEGEIHTQAGEVDTPEPGNRLGMINSKDVELLGYLEKKCKGRAVLQA